MRSPELSVANRFVIAIIFSIGATLLSAFAVYAASPPNLTSDILWTDTGGVYDPSNGIFNANFATIADIEAAFNNARRQEETQLGLTANALGNLTLPAGWFALSDDDKMLWLLNAERTARTGMTAGVIGLEFEALEVNIDALAQGHANYLNTANVTGHNDGSGNSPFDRIDNDAVIGENACAGVDGHEFLPRSENIAYFWTSGASNAMYIERSIYNWIYNDAGSSWGHREAALIQDVALNAASGFNNNYGVPTSEGFIGVGVVHSATYNPSGFTWSNMGTIVVLNFFDPVSDSVAIDCDYGPTVLAVTLSNAGTVASSSALFGILLSVAMMMLLTRGVKRLAD